MERSYEICRAVVQKSVNKNIIAEQISLKPSTTLATAGSVVLSQSAPTTVMTTVPTVTATPTVILAPVNPGAVLQPVSVPLNTVRQIPGTGPPPPPQPPVSVVVTMGQTTKPAVTIKPIPPSAETMAIVNAATSNIPRAGRGLQSNIRVQLPTTPLPQQQSGGGGVVVKAVKAEGPPTAASAAAAGGSVVVVAHPGHNPAAGPPVVRLPTRPIIVSPSAAPPRPPSVSVPSPGGGLLLPLLPSTPLQLRGATAVSAAPSSSSAPSNFTVPQENQVVLAPAARHRQQAPPQSVLVRKIPSQPATPSPPPQRLLAAGSPLARLGTPLPPQLPQEPVPLSQATAAGGFQRPLPRPASTGPPKPPPPPPMGTPLPGYLCLPSEPVPMDSQEMQLKLQQSPKMSPLPLEGIGGGVEVDAKANDEAVFTSPLPSPAPRALSRSSSLASNGSASPSHQVNGGGGSAAPKQIFVKVLRSEKQNQPRLEFLFWNTKCHGGKSR